MLIILELPYTRPVRPARPFSWQVCSSLDWSYGRHLRLIKTGVSGENLVGFITKHIELTTSVDSGKPTQTWLVVCRPSFGPKLGLRLRGAALSQ
jgi:hypothetical protein